MKKIPYGRQSLDPSDIKAVTDVLRTEWLTTGPEVPAFEKALARRTGAKFAVAVSNGTAALHLACLAAELKSDQELLTSPLSFVSSANCAHFLGARAVFCDICPDTGNIDPALLDRIKNPRLKALIAVHYAGLPCHMPSIRRWALKHKVTVIEDACHALGAKYRAGNKWFPVGSCSHSDMTVFSFHPVKSITTGEGGAITTNRRDLYEKLCRLRTHGIVKDPRAFEYSSEYRIHTSKGTVKADWYYEMQTLGLNYRMTDFQAALGRSQLKKLSKFIRERTAQANRYDRLLADLNEIILPCREERGQSAWHLYVIRLNMKKTREPRALLFQFLRGQGIGVQVHYIPIHLQPFYRKNGFRCGDFPVAETFYEASISLPIFPGLKPGQQRTVAAALKRGLQQLRVK